MNQESEVSHLHNVLVDLGTIAKATASHCGLLTGDLFTTFAQPVLSVLQSLLQALFFVSGPLTNLRNLRAPDTLFDCCKSLHGSLFTALESVFPWLAQFYATNLTSGNSEELSKLVRAIMENCSEPVLLLLDEKITQKASKTARSLTKIIRIPGMAELEISERMFRFAMNDSIWKLFPDVRVNLLCVVSNILLLPLTGQSNEWNGWEEKVEKHGKIIAAVTRNYAEALENGNPSKEVTIYCSKRLFEKSGTYCWECLKMLLYMDTNQFLDLGSLISDDFGLPSCTETIASRVFRS